MKDQTSIQAKPDDDIYRRVYLRVWRHPAFKPLTDDQKVLTFYLLTGPQTNLVGWYRFSPGMAAEDLDVTPSRLLRTFEIVLKAFEWQYDERTQLLWISTWHRWNPPNGLNGRKAWANVINGMPSGNIKQHLLHAIGMASGKPSAMASGMAFGTPSTMASECRDQRSEIQEQELVPGA